jgi:hypothetical protein
MFDRADSTRATPDPDRAVRPRRHTRDRDPLICVLRPDLTPAIAATSFASRCPANDRRAANGSGNRTKPDMPTSAIAELRWQLRACARHAMSAPRPVLPGRFLFITRRCNEMGARRLAG